MKDVNLMGPGYVVYFGPMPMDKTEPATTRRILIVDDHPVIRETLSDWIRQKSRPHRSMPLPTANSRRCG